MLSQGQAASADGHAGHHDGRDEHPAADRSPRPQSDARSSCQADVAESITAVTDISATTEITDTTAVEDSASPEAMATPAGHRLAALSDAAAVHGTASKTHEPTHQQTQPPTGEPRGIDYSAILDEDRVVGGDDDGGGEEGTAVLYVGDQQGLGFVVDICQPRRPFPGNHFVVPRAAAARSGGLLPEDVVALQAKGCFSLPDDAVQAALLRCYFHHVHPFLPVLHPGQFVRDYATGGATKINLLLLWSMFFASTNVSLAQTNMCAVLPDAC